MNASQRQSGFTILELILSVAVIGIISASSMPLFLSMQTRNELDIGANAIVSSLRRAQTLSIAMDADNAWGGSVQTGSITIFCGTSYVLRVRTCDETFAISTAIVPSGLTEVVFSKLTGDPQQTGTFTLTSGSNVRTVVINAKGTIDY